MSFDFAKEIAELAEVEKQAGAVKVLAKKVTSPVSKLVKNWFNANGAWGSELGNTLGKGISPHAHQLADFLNVGRARRGIVLSAIRGEKTRLLDRLINKHPEIANKLSDAANYVGENAGRIGETAGKWTGYGSAVAGPAAVLYMGKTLHDIGTGKQKASWERDDEKEKED